MRLDKRAKGTAVLSDCCEIPFAYVRDSGKVTVTMPHNREAHMLVLNIEDLERILAEARAKCSTIAREDKAA